MPLRNNGWLEAKHPVWLAMHDEWLANERRALGGNYVVDELIPFDWEIENGPHHSLRKNNAVYLNFPDRFSSIMVGHLMRQAPTPDFGELGEVRRGPRRLQTPTPAELVNYNVDGVGNDGSQWDNFWMRAAKGAIHTGNQWLLGEGPPDTPRNLRDAEKGLRPFLRRLSPRSVTNWHYVDGNLQFAVVRQRVRRPRVGRDGSMEGNLGEDQYLFLCREGFNDFGREYGMGGWFIFDAEGGILDFGDYDTMEGEIPMVPLYYERIEMQEDIPMISRSGTTELGNCAISYMNVSSAADFDCWDAATSVAAVLGADEEGFNLFIAKRKQGNRYAPVPPSRDTGKNPDIKDISMGALAGDTFERRLNAKREEALQLMLNEMQSAPYASGESKKVTWTDSRAPRLAVFAHEIETAQNSMIRALERLWGNRTSSGVVTWRKDFNLQDPVMAMQEFFEAEEKAGIKSGLVGRKLLILAAQAYNVIQSDEEINTATAEYDKSAQLRLKQQEAEANEVEAKTEATKATATKTLMPEPAPPAPVPAPQPLPELVAEPVDLEPVRAEIGEVRNSVDEVKAAVEELQSKLEEAIASSAGSKRVIRFNRDKSNRITDVVQETA